MIRVIEPSSEQLARARILAREGATAVAIGAALGWTCKPPTVIKRLARYGIRIKGRRLAHDGCLTSLGRNGRFQQVDQGRYRAGPAVPR